MVETAAEQKAAETQMPLEVALEFDTDCWFVAVVLVVAAVAAFPGKRKDLKLQRSPCLQLNLARFLAADQSCWSWECLDCCRSRIHRRLRHHFAVNVESYPRLHGVEELHGPA